MGAPKKQRRTIDAIQASGFVILAFEAEQTVGCSYGTLYRKFQEGRLHCYGRPLKTDYDHLIEQVRNDFPKLVTEAA